LHLQRSRLHSQLAELRYQTDRTRGGRNLRVLQGCGRRGVGFRIEDGVGLRVQGTGLFDEGLDQRVEFLDLVRLLRGEVGSFAEVLLEVEQLMQALEIGGAFGEAADRGTSGSRA
jgi:hypothetical protein